MRKLIFLPLLFSLCIVFTGCEAVSPPQPATGYNNTVTMLDVGQAACTLIESEGQFCLIDAGKAGGSTDIVAYLNHRGVKKLDLLVLTHFHYDHTSEALDIIRNFDIGTVLIPSLSAENIPDSYFYKSLEEDGANGYYKLEYAVKDMEFKVGRGTLKVASDTFNSENINNTSVVTVYTLDDFVYVNTGDTESDREVQILDCLPENVDFLTAGHHGSQDSTSQALLDRLKPGFVGISCGKDNDYGHPHKRVLERLDNMDIPYSVIYETGNIVYSMDTKTATAE